MENAFNEKLNQAKQNVLESWQIFKVTGDIFDAQELITDLQSYDKILLEQSNESDMEM